MGFDEQENLLLVEKLKDFGINIRMARTPYGKGFYISLTTENAQKLFHLIKPLVWPIECMRYKLKFIG